MATGAGHLPALLVSTQALLNAADTYPPASWTLASIATHAALVAHGEDALDTDFTLTRSAAAVLGLSDLVSEEDEGMGRLPACDAVAAGLAHTLAAATNLTLNDIFGMTARARGSHSGWRYPSHPDAYLNLAVRSNQLALAGLGLTFGGWV